MLQQLHVPPNMVAFRAVGPVTGEDYREVLVPGVNQLIHFRRDMNFLIVLEDSVFTNTFGLWIYDVLKSLSKVRGCNRAAIVSDLTKAERLSKAHSIFPHGKLRNFQIRDLGRAISWTSGGDLSI